MRSPSGLSLVPLASGEPIWRWLAFSLLWPQVLRLRCVKQEGAILKDVFAHLPSAFIRGRSWTCSWSTINRGNFAWQRDYSNCLYDRNGFLEHKVELQNELRFSAGLMTFLRLLKFVYLFFHSRSAGERKYLTGFITGL